MKLLNLENAKNEFIQYADSYDLKNDHMNRKKYHSIRVMEISDKLAKEENFTEEEIEIATVIGILHDIARFKQYTEYQTFKDQNSFDHGDVAIEILEKDNYLRKYIKTDKYDEIIKVAIKNHNKFEIEKGLTEEQNKFCKLIRDADKIDILFQATGLMWREETEAMENSKIDIEMKKEFDQQKLFIRSKFPKVDYANKILAFLGFIFDINYISSLKIIKEKKYVEQIINRYKFKDAYTQKAIIDAGEKVNQFIINKMEQ